MHTKITAPERIHHQRRQLRHLQEFDSAAHDAAQQEMQQQLVEEVQAQAAAGEGDD